MLEVAPARSGNYDDQLKLNIYLGEKKLYRSTKSTKGFFIVNNNDTLL